MKGMQHEVVRQLCRPQINAPAGRPPYGLLKEADGPGNLSVVTTGNGCPAVRSDPIRHAAEMFAVTSRDAQIAEQSRFANLTTTWLEATLDRFGFFVLSDNLSYMFQSDMNRMSSVHDKNIETVLLFPCRYDRSCDTCM